MPRGAGRWVRFWHRLPDSDLIPPVRGISVELRYLPGMRYHLSLLLICALPGLAGGQDAPTHALAPGPDVELARDLVERGEILPLAKVLALLQARHPGQIVEVELEYSHGKLVYEVDMITRDGRLIEVDMDAATGEIVDLEEEDD